jgi:heme/copper-type cytochrome/quinol oxidase subunit 3
MEIPYTVQLRPDTGVYNAKSGHLAFPRVRSHALRRTFFRLRFAARRGAPGYWPHGWLDVRFGTLNTIILALSAITTLLAWVACKVGHFGKFKFFHACTLLLALSFLCVKMYEYHDKVDSLRNQIERRDIRRRPPG